MLSISSYTSSKRNYSTSPSSISKVLCYLLSLRVWYPLSQLSYVSYVSSPSLSFFVIYSPSSLFQTPTTSPISHLPLPSSPCTLHLLSPLPLSSLLLPLSPPLSTFLSFICKIFSVLVILPVVYSLVPTSLSSLSPALFLVQTLIVVAFTFVWSLFVSIQKKIREREGEGERGREGEGEGGERGGEVAGRA